MPTSKEEWISHMGHVPPEAFAVGVCPTAQDRSMIIALLPTGLSNMEILALVEAIDKLLTAIVPQITERAYSAGKGYIDIVRR